MPRHIARVSHEPEIALELKDSSENRRPDPRRETWVICTTQLSDDYTAAVAFWRRLVSLQGARGRQKDRSSQLHWPSTRAVAIGPTQRSRRDASDLFRLPISERAEAPVPSITQT